MASFTDNLLQLDHGDTDYLDFAATKADGTPQPITGWTISFTLKWSLADPDAAAVVHKTTTAGTVTVTDAAGGLGTVPMLPADYAAIPNRTAFLFGDLVGKDTAGGVNRIWKGMAEIMPTVSITP